MTKIIKNSYKFGFMFLAFFALSAMPLTAKEEVAEVPKEIASLQELLEKVKNETEFDSVEDRARVAKFMAEQSTQDKVLKSTISKLVVQEDRAVLLEKTFDENDVKLSELEDLKAERLGAFGELFGVVRGTASEMGAQIK